MRSKYSAHPIRSLVLSFIYLTSALTGNSFAQEQNKYLRAVREFADNVLKYGRDVYGLKHTPLFVDGLQGKSLKPVIWKKDGQSWMLCNFASRQPLLRTLDGLTTLTGQKEYRKAAEAATGYALKHLRTPNGLLYWGGHMAWDLEQEQPVGQYADVHELKGHQPSLTVASSIVNTTANSTGISRNAPTNGRMITSYSMGTPEKHSLQEILIL